MRWKVEVSTKDGLFCLIFIILKKDGQLFATNSLTNDLTRLLIICNSKTSISLLVGYRTKISVQAKVHAHLRHFSLTIMQRRGHRHQENLQAFKSLYIHYRVHIFLNYWLVETIPCRVRMHKSRWDKEFFSRESSRNLWAVL